MQLCFSLILASPWDTDIEQLAKESAQPLIYFGDLGEDSQVKVIGLFSHSGVANHPGDLGMETIAKRIFMSIKNMLRIGN